LKAPLASARGAPPCRRQRPFGIAGDRPIFRIADARHSLLALQLAQFGGWADTSAGRKF
jgi:hypothetical protein